MLCSDGTGNSGGKGNGTNVWRLFKAVKRSGPFSQSCIGEQVAFHDDGVGTQELKFFKIGGGAFGAGLSRNVRQLYTELVRNYEPGDRIYLFGFSRGAFTVRTLAGLILETGIINAKGKSDRQLKKLVKQAFAIHRNQYPAVLSYLFSLGGAFKPKLADFRKSSAIKNRDGVIHEPRIRFVGVWDTVSAVGFPVAGIAEAWNKFVYKFQFPDRYLGEGVDIARHALSVDDQRLTFHPTLWDESEHPKRIEQIWFAGVHSNVGGGYPKDGLAYVSLDWMFKEASKAGLDFYQADVDRARDRANALEQLYDSRAGFAVYYRYMPRDIGELCRENKVKPKIHESVLQRIVSAPEGYAPGNLPCDFELISTRVALSKPAENLTEWYNAQRAEGASLLSEVKPWIVLRRSAHWIMFIVTVAVGYFAWASGHQSFGASSASEAIERASSVFSPSAPADVLKVIFNQVILNPLGQVLIGALFLTYFLGHWGKSKIKQHFSQFWNSRVLAKQHSPEKFN